MGVSKYTAWSLSFLLFVSSVATITGGSLPLYAAYEQPQKKNIATRIGRPARPPSIWTDWYRYPLVVGLLKLAKLRKNLDSHNLFDVTSEYPAHAGCSPLLTNVRSADGSCNDRSVPWMGSAGVRFGHNLALSSVRHVSDEEILSPNPRLISDELMTRDSFKPVTGLNMLAAAWIQFMVHDWFSHGDNTADAPFEVPAASTSADSRMMLVPRTAPDDSRSPGEQHLPPTYKNEVTHWWDGSQLYGSNAETLARLRKGEDGLLKTASSGRLLIDSDGIELTGFKRNWWSGLSLMHELFVAEHNAIAVMLKSHYPTWDDEQIFQKARLITSALMAKIHTVEWTPAILNNRTLRTAMRANWYRLINPTEVTNPGFEIISHPVLTGLVGGARELHGVPFTMTEEFVSVYRMHPLLPESIEVRDALTGRLRELVQVIDTRDEHSHEVIDRHGLGHLMYSFGLAHPGALTLNNYPNFLRDINVPIVGPVDLAAVDIIRDRERGVPRYNEFRRRIQLTPIRQFTDLTPDAAVAQKLSEIYGGDIEKLDLLVGCLAEAHRPTGYGFGETAFQIFVLMASRRLEADRFYTTDYRPEVYTQEGLDWIDQNSMKSVISRHIPGLAPKVQGLPDAFRPWHE